MQPGREPEGYIRFGGLDAPPSPVRSCQMFAFRRRETLRHRKRENFHLLFVECFWQWGIGALHGKF